MKRWRERANVITEVINNTLNVSMQKTFREAVCGNTLKWHNKQQHFLGNSDFSYLKSNLQGRIHTPNSSSELLQKEAPVIAASSAKAQLWEQITTL